MGKCLFMRKGETHTSPNVGLPNGYTELEYIESTGTQYIDTGFIPNQDTSVVAEMEYVSHTDATCGLFGTSTSFECFYYKGEYRFIYGNQNGVVTKAVSVGQKMIIDFSKERATFDIGGTVIDVTPSATATFTSAYTLFIHALHRNGTAQYQSISRTYSFKIYDNGTLVRDFVPCIDPDGNIGLYDTVNKKFYGNKGTGVFKCNLSFENYTWEQIITACQTNTVPSFWNVGDQKIMTINGADYQIDIIGKNHDTYTGGGTAPLTFQMHDCYGTAYAMNSSNTNSGGWSACAMRNTHLPTILSLMPSEVQGGIKSVEKRTFQGNGSVVIQLTQDKLFLLAEFEIFGTNTHSLAGEYNVQYAYYAAGNSKAKTTNGSANSWWTRSPRNSTSSDFCNVYNDGTNDASSASGGRGVSFAFCF